MPSFLSRRSVGLAALLALGCGVAARAVAVEDLTGVLVRGGGSSFAAPLMRGWIAGFVERYPGVTIDYDSIGSGEGMSRFVTGSLDFAGTDAPLPASLAGIRQGPVLQVPLAGGLVALCYNLPGLDGALRLPRAVYAGILDGTIRRWDDPQIVAANPGVPMPARTIAVVVRRDGSGTTFALTRHLATIDPRWQEQKLGAAIQVDWPAGAMTARGNEGVAATVRQAEYSIGYVEYGFARRLGLRMAALENRNGEFVEPSVAAGVVALGGAESAVGTDPSLVGADPSGPGSYPIVTLTWALLGETHEDERKARLLRTFLGWGLSEGRSIAESLQYVTLPETLVAGAHRTLEQVR